MAFSHPVPQNLAKWNMYVLLYVSESKTRTVRTNDCMYVCTYVCRVVIVSMHACMYVCVCVRVCACVIVHKHNKHTQHTNSVSLWLFMPC